MTSHRLFVPIAGALLFLLLVVFWCVPHTVRAIESDIYQRAAAVVGDLPGVAVAVDGQDVTLSGDVANRAASDALLEQIGTLRGVRSVNDQLSVVAAPAPATPAPGIYFFDAQRLNDQVVMTGFVENDAQRASIVGLARQTFAPTRVIDRLAQAPSAPANFDDTVKAALRTLAQLDEGRYRLTARAATLSGVAPDPATRLAVESSFGRESADAIETTVTLTLRPADGARRESCQREFNRLLRGKVVRFATGSATISADSFPLLDGLSSATKDCADVAIEVRGHTDAMGDPDANQRLSERRASAVVDYLVADGVDAAGLRSSGLGETQPVQPNDTPAGRAANRRIEFVVLESARP